ncbi:hypothetical protein QBC34DRAFT_183640 [Podospora aff. communis PSN243]|uniref:Uncharacterized protein n=1 Tax=Podospora aff. communis PSN243 TaxID=3040156 RepID=A0AAV9GB58_9PEZI|nr:hypothetical protein QBC34DRAFT_183640 [Podospora aff. communis PSN243]
MFPKQVSRLLLVATLQQAAYALPVGVVTNSEPPADPATWCPENGLFGPTPTFAGCSGAAFWCGYWMTGVIVGGCVKDEAGEWVPSRKWTGNEAMDYMLSGKVPASP